MLCECVCVGREGRWVFEVQQMSYSSYPYMSVKVHFLKQDTRCYARMRQSVARLPGASTAMVVERRLTEG